MVDIADAERVKQFVWHPVPARHTFYARTSIWANGRYRQLLLHRLLMEPRPEQDIDHKNGDGLNCTRKNMRKCTNAQNRRNQRLSQASTSGYKGVSWHSARREWQASIRHEGVTVHLGHFDTAIDAARAYDNKARELHKGFARLNFPGERLPPTPPKTKTKRNNTSGYPGVTFFALEGKWKARKMVDGRRKCFGTFLTAEAAWGAMQGQ